MFLDAFCSFLGILMFFHNVLLYVSRLTFNFFDLEVRARAEPFGVLFCNRFVSGSKFLREKRRAAVFVAPLLSSAAFSFRPGYVTRLSPSQHLAWGSLLQNPLDRLWLVWFRRDKIKEHRVWTRLTLPCSDALG